MSLHLPSLVVFSQRNYSFTGYLRDVTRHLAFANRYTALASFCTLLMFDAMSLYAVAIKLYKVEFRAVARHKIDVIEMCFPWNFNAVRCRIIPKRGVFTLLGISSLKQTTCTRYTHNNYCSLHFRDCCIFPVL